MSYLPLQFINNCLKDGPPFEILKDMLKTSGVKNIEDVTADDFVQFACSDGFCNPKYEGPFKRFNWNLYNNPRFIRWLADNTGADITDFTNGKFSIVTEWRDFLLAPLLWERWAKNKQVYKPDKDFAEALIGTKSLSLSRDQIEHLPCKSFYIDMDACEADPAMGAFVFVESSATGFYIAVYLLTSDMLFFSFYGGGQYDENGMLQIDINSMRKSRGFEVYSSHAEKVGMDPLEDGKRTLKLIGKHDRVWTTNFALQMLCYLTSSKPDVLENPVTQKTYKPTTVVRNRFSEVQQWDVGVRYGTTVRTKLKEEQERFLKESEVPADVERDECQEKETDTKEKKKRKSPVPHYRAAHWHRYWTGEGRKVCEVRWVEPVFVGFSEAKDVVIHKMRGRESPEIKI